MAIERFKTQLDKLLQKRGTSRIWLWRQFKDDHSRTHFWRKVNSDTLTKEEKQKIKFLLK